MLFHCSRPLLNPQFPFFLSTPIPRKLKSLQTLNFPIHWNLFYSLSSSFNHQQHVLGDSLVFEDGIFEDPFLHNNSNSHNLTKPKKKNKKKRNAAPPQIVTENLVPEKWREIQTQINIAKKESMKTEQEMEFNSKVEIRRRALIQLKDVNMDEYKAYKKAKLAELNPLVLDNPSRFRVKEEDFVEKEEDGDDEFGGTERVKPKNPRWAVYGRSLKDVSQFLNSDIYDPHANNSIEGHQNLLTKEEKVLLRRGMLDLASATSDKWLPLHSLAACGEFYLVDSLMKHNVDINAVDKDGLTALHKAIIGKNQAITNYLLMNSANPFVKDKDRATLMHYAVQTASSQTIKILLLYNVDINQQDKDGWTPLHLAVQTQRTDLVRLLLINGADKALKNKDGLTPLDLCLYLGQGVRTYELIKLLKQQPQS